MHTASCNSGKIGNDSDEYGIGEYGNASNDGGEYSDETGNGNDSVDSSDNVGNGECDNDCGECDNENVNVYDMNDAICMCYAVR